MADMDRKKKDGKPSPGPVPQQSHTSLDDLRAAARVRHFETVPIWLLVVLFVLVEGVVIWLMWGPQLSNDYAAFFARRNVSEGRYDKAIPWYQSLVKSNPTAPTFLAELGTCYYNTKQYDDAFKYYQLAQENRDNIQPDDQGNKPEVADFNSSMGMAMWKKHDLANAEKYLKLAIAHNKVDKIANYTMGELEFSRGNYPAATAYFKIVAQDPEYKDRVQKYYAEIEQKLFSKIRS